MCACGEVLVSSKKVKLVEEGRSMIQLLVWLHDTVALRSRLAGWLARGSVNSRSFVRVWRSEGLVVSQARSVRSVRKDYDSVFDFMTRWHCIAVGKGCNQFSI